MTSELTVAELRGLVETSLDDDALQLLIDAAESQIADVVGTTGQLELVYEGGSRFVILDRFVASVDHVYEGELTDDLATVDGSFRLRDDGRSLERLEPGCETCQRLWWGPVRVTVTPRDHAALRKVATVQLVKAAMNNNPGILGLTEGNFTIQFANGETWTGTQEDAIAGIRRPWSFG